MQRRHRTHFKSTVTLAGLSFILMILGCSPKMFSVKYDPVDGEMNKSIGQNTEVGILDIPDRRRDSEGKETMIGTVYGGFEIPLWRIYSEQPINHDVMNAFGNLFSANGFIVTKYPRARECDELTDERLCVRGHINQFWIRTYDKDASEYQESVEAEVDIDIELKDRKHHEVIWGGKASAFRRTGGSMGIFTDTEKMVSVLSETFSLAINLAWTKKGMREALERWRIREALER